MTYFDATYQQLKKNTIHYIYIVFFCLINFIGQTQAAVVICQNNYSTSTQKNYISADNLYKIALNGNILAGKDVIVNGWLLIERNGNIGKVGCLEQQYENYDVIQEKEIAQSNSIPTLNENAIISPAFINAHDHIKYNTYYPLNSKKYQALVEKTIGDKEVNQQAYNRLTLSDQVPYQFRHEWRTSLITNPEELKTKTKEALLWNELRYILGGTLIFADNKNRGNDHIENVSDRSNGLSKTIYETFPFVEDKSMTPERLAVISGFNDAESPEEYNCSEHKSIWAKTWNNFSKKDTIVAHLGEGFNSYSRAETRCLLKELSEINPDHQPNLTMIHALEFNKNWIPDNLHLNKLNMVWSPRSNYYLYKDTAPVKKFKDLGITIALGSDWIPSGSLNLFRELKCAINYNNKYPIFSNQELWEMVTANAAHVLGLNNVGLIKDGLRANILVVTPTEFTSEVENIDEEYYKAVITSSNENVSLVLKDGVPLYGDNEIMEQMLDRTLNQSRFCSIITMCKGVMKKICLKNYVSPSGDPGQTLSAFIESHDKNSRTELKETTPFYKLFTCQGSKINGEPTCDIQ